MFFDREEKIKKAMLLYAVTDRKWSKEADEKNRLSLIEQVNQAIKGGATCIQLREKNLGYDEFLREAKEISKICRDNEVVFIVNDNVDIAIKSNADGVHVGQEDMVASDVRKKIGNEMILGVSVHDIKEAEEALKNGADYFGLGAVFSTSTKTDVDIMSYDDLKRICKEFDLPTVAIGGICQDNIMELKGSGVDGVAVVSAIFASDDIVETTKKLKILSEKMVGVKPDEGI